MGTPLPYPVWNVAGGDTIDCIVSHIDYGDELWFNDWTKGDVGSSFTYTHNVGVITAEGMSVPNSHGEQGYRYLDVTYCVFLDYVLDNIHTQYRIAFEIDTDYDDLLDRIDFSTSDASNPEHWPRLYFTYWDGVSVDQDELAKMADITIYPQPVRDTATLQLQLRQAQQIEVDVYDIRGRHCGETVQTSLSSGLQQLTLDFRNRPNGVYLVRIEADGRYKISPPLGESYYRSHS
ncbi:MAG: T9SS type A sorting domain-containing protein [Candidatus Cloacimonetes bacterium]|nr:T9SS type A sorting domain-containing protein [Candidatus Cloacimonadota bacterium]